MVKFFGFILQTVTMIVVSTTSFALEKESASDKAAKVLAGARSLEKTSKKTSSSKIEKSRGSSGQKDLQSMNKARALFASGKFKAAIAIYSKIPASSDFWLDSIEERAWSWVRLHEYEKALADLQSINSAFWTTQVSPESAMLSAFVSLKICAYKDVVEKLDQFKKRMLPRVTHLQNLVDKPWTEESTALLSKLQSEKITMASLGVKAEEYPRYFYRDVQLLSAVRKASWEQAKNRMRQLAQEDLAEIESNLKKMKVIEVEVIQTVLAQEKDQKKKSKLKFESVDRDQSLVFPVTDDEVWIDEVGHFQVKADQCPQKEKL